MGFANRCHRLVEAPAFGKFIIVVILLAGLAVGLETFPGVVERYGDVLHALDFAIIAIFVIEIVLKMAARMPKPWLFFTDPWNVFDFLIVAVCLIPAGDAEWVPVLRLFRLLRVLRLLTAIPKLQLLVGALLKSLPSMGYVTVLLFLIFYIYGVTGVMLFAENDPIHFGDLWKSLLTLFRVVTLEDWTDVMYLQMYGSDGYSGYNQPIEGIPRVSKAMPIVGALFFVSFVLLGTMIVLNLVIGVVINGMDEASAEAEVNRIRLAKARLTPPEELALNDQIAILSRQIQELNVGFTQLKAMASLERKPPSQNS